MSRKRVSAEEIINKLHEEEIFDTITQTRVVTERWCNTYNKISSGRAKTDGQEGCGFHSSNFWTHQNLGKRGMDLITHQPQYLKKPL